MSDDETDVVDYEPDFESECETCGQTPTVMGINATGKVVLATGLCGPCTWGEAEMLDWSKWNEKG
jgi:hypothetical protein